MSDAKQSPDVRGRLRSDASEHYDKVLNALLSATEASKPVKRKCDRCGHQNEFLVPDSRSQIDAASKLVELGYGRAPTEKESAEVDLGADIFAMDAEELAEHKRRIVAAYPEAAEAFAKGLAGESVSNRAMRRAVMLPKKRSQR